MAKRSPILGYNHNVRYRGLVFHVQTEDSGLLSPHLFTHLFHGGVIVATRKLVYDAGAVEDVIKNLMQAQHKAVLKELKRGGFDDKIDQYLGDTAGLLPRGAKDPEAGEAPERPSVVEMTPAPAVDPVSEPIELVPPTPAPAPVPPAPLPIAPPIPPPTPAQAARTVTASRTRAAPSAGPPPPHPIEESTLTDDAAAVAAAVASTRPVPRAATPAHGVRPSSVPMPARTSTASAAQSRTTTPPRAATPPPIPSRTGSSSRSLPTDFRIDSSPEIEISLEADDGGRGRAPRDTSVESQDSVPSTTLETAATEAHSRTSDPPPVPERQRNASHGAATLPALARPNRPQAKQAPAVMTRPVPTDDGRPRRESEVIEVYAPAPPSAEAPPGERADRPGQYIVNRTQKKSEEKPPMRDVAIRFSGSNEPRSLTGGTQPLPKPNADNLTARPRTPTPARPPNSPSPTPTLPMHPRTSSPGGAGVITTRPAVIVGAPQKPAPAPPRVRKAREEEGRGFGQGLISEKSLDEVILAYLSEDAEEK